MDKIKRNQKPVRWGIFGVGGVDLLTFGKLKEDVDFKRSRCRLKVAISGGFEQVLAQTRPFLIIFTVLIFNKF